MIRQQPIGWAPAKLAASLKRGASGVMRVALTVTNADGSPLSSYAGWTAKAAFFLEGEAEPTLILAPVVQPNPAQSQLIVDLDFRTADTSQLVARKFRGDLALTDPDDQVHYALDIELSVARNWTPLT